VLVDGFEKFKVDLIQSARVVLIENLGAESRDIQPNALQELLVIDLTHAHGRSAWVVKDGRKVGIR